MLLVIYGNSVLNYFSVIKNGYGTDNIIKPTGKKNKSFAYPEKDDPERTGNSM
jgi:hypothetical protein